MRNLNTNHHAALEEEKIKVRQTLDSISSRFKGPVDSAPSDATAMDGITSVANDETTPSHDTEHPLSHPYILRGVATRPGVVYLLHPTAVFSALTASEVETQWLRIEYSTANPDLTAVFGAVSLE